MVRIVWGVILILLGLFGIIQALNAVVIVQASSDLAVEFSRSLGQRSPKGLDAFALTDFWSSFFFGVVLLISGSLLIYFGDRARKKQTRVTTIQRLIIPDDSDQHFDW